MYFTKNHKHKIAKCIEWKLYIFENRIGNEIFNRFIEYSVNSLETSFIK